MSYLSRVEVAWDDSEADRLLDEERFVARAAEFLRANDISEDVLADLRDAMRGPLHDGVGFNSFDAELTAGLFEHVSAGFPGVRVVVRGAGEEPLDCWIREFVGGETTLAHGPFGDP